MGCKKDFFGKDKWITWVRSLADILEFMAKEGYGVCQPEEGQCSSWREASGSGGLDWTVKKDELRVEGWPGQVGCVSHCENFRLSSAWGGKLLGHWAKMI